MDEITTIKRRLNNLIYGITIAALICSLIITLADKDASADDRFYTESVDEFDVQVIQSTAEVDSDFGVLFSDYNESESRIGTKTIISAENVLVSKGDTLRNIARTNRVDGTTTNQMMLAIAEANQHAFLNGNINLLKAGAILRIPDLSEIISVNQSQTAVEVARQESALSTTVPEIDHAGTAQHGALSRKLQLAREELASTKQELAELLSRNQSLQRTIKNMELSIILLQDKVVELEQQLAHSHRSSSTQPDKIAVAENSDNVSGQVGFSGERGSNAERKMTWVNVLSYAVVAALLVISPGPNGVLIAKTVPTSGRAAGFANVAGFVVALYFHGTLSILGISAILLASAQAFLVIKVIGALYLCWIGFKALRDAYRGNNAAQTVEPANRQRTLRAAFVEGLLTNALNPKTSMFYLAAFPQFITTGDGAIASAYLLVFLQSVINVVWFSAMVTLFVRLTKVGQNASFQRWLKAITGGIFIGFGVKLATVQA